MADPDDRAAGRISPLDRLAQLKPRNKEPGSKRILETWIAQAQPHAGVDVGRLGWLIASTVVIAALQQTRDGDTQRPRFLLKGGTYLQHRLQWAGRSTKDIDGIVCGDIDDFVESLDVILRRPWGPLQLSRTEVEVINTPNRVVKPRRFTIKASIKGQAWRSVQIEISPDEGGAGNEEDILRAPPLKTFGLPTPGTLFGIALRYQVAQKLHACTDPHSPPDAINDRVRDVVDLVLLHNLVAEEGQPSLGSLREAGTHLFDARAHEARTLGRAPRPWPPTVTIHPHWHRDFNKLAADATCELSLDQCVEVINRWITEIDETS